MTHKGHKKITSAERDRIAKWVSQQVGVREIARRLNRSPSSISDELVRNTHTIARRSTILDNGRENHLHYLLGELGMITFFADPYSSWQRGTNEYHNGVLRRYLTKGTDFTMIDDEELQDIVDEINNRPRKCLGWSTPREEFTKQLGVRIQKRM